MASLLSKLKAPKPERNMSIDAYAQMLSQFAYNGLNYTPPLQMTLGGQTTERPPGTFQGLAEQAYGSNGIVFACMLVRQLVFSGIRFQYQRFLNGKPSNTFGLPDLALLEQPWPGGTTQDFLTRLIQDADLAGNSYWVRQGDELVRLRPDWVQIVGAPRTMGAADSGRGGGQVGWVKRGYLYTEGGFHPGNSNEPVAFTVDEVAHFAPIPDPLGVFTGMSWLTPILREIQVDRAMSRHQRRYFDNGATPNMVVKHALGAAPDAVKKFAADMANEFGGVENAYKTLHLYPGADATVVGSDFKQVDFSNLRDGGETRIAAAAGVPPVIAGLSKGLDSATYCGTYNEAVWTTRGVAKLGEIEVGDSVWSFVDNRVESRKVLWHSQTGTKQVYTIRTKNRTIRFTDNHPILVRVPGNSAGSNSERSARVAWRRVDELKVGDRVVQAQRLPDQGLTSLPNGTPATAEVLQWLGAYTGDGCLSGQHGVRMCIPVNDRARPRYAALAGNLFTKRLSWQTPGRRANDGLTPEMVRLHAEGLNFREIVEHMKLSLHPMSVRDRIRTATREYTPATAPVVLREARNSFEFSSTHAVRWHHAMGVIGTAKTKRVPRWIFELSEELRLAYLAGVVDTDGSVGKDGRLSIQFASEQLVEDVRMLLISCGIACSNIAHAEFAAAILPNPGSRDVYEAWRFVASSAVEVGRIPFADPLYRERVDANKHRHRPGGLDAAKAGLHEDLGFYTVRSIEIGPAEPVFDIEVEDGHSFLVDGVVVHNSNYGQARRRFGDGTMHPLWKNAAGSIQNVVTPPSSSARLWYDTSDVSFLREDEADAANIAAVRASTINTYVASGFTPESAVATVDSGDINLLKHSGLVSVQLLPPGTSSSPAPSGQPKRVASSRDVLQIELIPREALAIEAPADEIEEDTSDDSAT